MGQDAVAFEDVVEDVWKYSTTLMAKEQLILTECCWLSGRLNGAFIFDTNGGGVI